MPCCCPNCAMRSRWARVQVTPDDDFVVRRVPQRDDGFAQRLLAPCGTGPGRWAHRMHSGSPTPVRAARSTRVSYYQALEPGLLPPGFFRDKVVLVGRAVRTDAELSGSRHTTCSPPFSVADGGDRLFPWRRDPGQPDGQPACRFGCELRAPWGAVCAAGPVGTVSCGRRGGIRAGRRLWRCLGPARMADQLRSVYAGFGGWHPGRTHGRGSGVLRPRCRGRIWSIGAARWRAAHVCPVFRSAVVEAPWPNRSPAPGGERAN